VERKRKAEMLRFNELSSTPKNSRLLKEEVREGFYIYFVIYRSPSISNREEEKRESYNLYVGIKYTPGEKAENFFGSIRYDGSKNYFDEKAPSGLFRDYLFRLEDGEPLVAPEEIYCTSASKTGSETLSHAYETGIVHQNKFYHPLICSKKTYKQLAGDGKKIIPQKVKEFVQVLTSYLKKFLKESTGNFNSKRFLTEKPQTSKDNISTEGVYYYPLSINQGSHLSFATSKDYGYRIYVCDDMDGYVSLLNEIVNQNQDVKAIETVERKKNEYDKDLFKNAILIVQNIIDNYFISLKMQFPEKLESFEEDDYREFLIKQIKENPSNLVTSFEGDMQKALKKDGNLTQAENNDAESFFKDPVTVRRYFLPSQLTDKEKEEFIKDIFPDADDEEAQKKKEERKANRGKLFSSMKTIFNESTKDENISLISDAQIKIRPQDRFSSTAYTRAVMNFTDPTTLGNRIEGLKEENYISPPIWFGEENSLLKRFCEKNDNEAKAQLRHIIENFEIPVALLKHPTKRLNQLCIVVNNLTGGYSVKKGKKSIVLKQNNQINLRNLDINYLPTTAFTMFDLVKKLGYSIDKTKRGKDNERERLYDFVKRNKIKHNIRLESTSINLNYELAGHLLNEDLYKASLHSVERKYNVPTINQTSLKAKVNFERLSEAFENNENLNLSEIIRQDLHENLIRDTVSKLTKKIKDKSKKLSAVMIAALMIAHAGASKADFSNEKMYDKAQEYSKTTEFKNDTKSVSKDIIDQIKNLKSDSKKDNSTKLSKGTQSEKSNKLALNFIKDLLGSSTPKFNKIFIEDKQISSMKELQTFITAPGMKYIKQNTSSNKNKQESVEFKSFNQFISEEDQ
jgi:hypothetical protein